MKILLINEKYEAGGSELQVLREIRLLLENGHSVWLLSMDSNIPCVEFGEEKKVFLSDDLFFYHCNILPKPFYRRRITRALKSFVKNNTFSRQIKNVIMQILPDAIHINNIIHHEALSVYRAVKGYKCIQTFRDCRVYCPRIYGVDSNGGQCSGCFNNICYKKCSTGKRVRDIVNDYLEYKALLYIGKKRGNTVKIITPSNFLADMSRSNGYAATVIHDLLNKDEFLQTKKCDFSHKRFICYGRLCEAKGISRLSEAFSKLNEGDIELIFAGSIESEYKDKFFSILEGNKNIKYIGVLEHERVKAILDDVYAVIVPSIVLENYPNTALEGFARKRLVLGTNRAGCKEIIGDERFLFDIQNIDNVSMVIEKALELTEKDYNEFVEYKYNELFKSCNDKHYYEQLMDAIDC